MTNKIILPALFFTLLLLFSAAQAAYSQQTELSVSISEAQQLVTVQGNTDFNQMLSGYSYDRELTIKWAIPNSALEKINAPEVTVYATITRSKPDSWLAFKRAPENKPVKAISLQLNCIVANGSCTSSSVLEKKFFVTAQQPANAQYPHADGIIINASLQPFTPTYEEELAAELLQSAQTLRQQSQELNGNETQTAASARISDSLNKADSALALDDYEAATKQLEFAKKELEKVKEELETQSKINPLTGLFTATGKTTPIIAGIIVVILIAGYFVLNKKKKYTIDDTAREVEVEEGLGKKVPYHHKK